MKTKVIVATYEHRHGTDIRVFDSFEKAQVWKDEIGADRINNDGNYEPSNCRWATDAEQRANKRTRRQVHGDS